MWMRGYGCWINRLVRCACKDASCEHCRASGIEFALADSLSTVYRDTPGSTYFGRSQDFSKARLGIGMDRSASNFGALFDRVRHRDTRKADSKNSLELFHPGRQHLCG